MSIVAVDFDGTVVTHDYPVIGDDIGAVPVLKELVAAGHNLILWTMRSGDALEEAVGWFRLRDIPLWGINENPTQSSWTISPKAYAHYYIDDAGISCPLIYPSDGGRPYVDWVRVRQLLVLHEIL